MTRIAVLLIFACALSGGLFYIWKSGIDSEGQKFKEAVEKNLEGNIGATGTVVYVHRDIEEGETITADAIEELELIQSKIPSGAVPRGSVALGRTSKYGISKGEIVSLYDLDPFPPEYMEPAVHAIKDIPEGAVIKADAIEEFGILKYSAPKDGLTKSSMAVGKKAKHALSEGQILDAHDVEP